MIVTDGYAPPEQYRGEASPAGDMYALGATLHHLLTRRDPRAEAPFSFSERPIRELNPNVSPELEAAINASLAYNPQDRFPTAEAMKSALMSVAKETGILVSPKKAAAVQPRSDVQAVWSFECEDEIRGAPIVMNGVVYIGCYDNNLYALDAQSANPGVPPLRAICTDIVTREVTGQAKAKSAERARAWASAHTSASTSCFSCPRMPSTASALRYFWFVCTPQLLYPVP